MAKLYEVIAIRLGAIANCRKSGNAEWLEKHTGFLKAVAREFLPSGSGIDQGTRLDLEASTPECLVMHTEFHHIDSESGMYDGWTKHTVRVKPSLAHGINLTISGPNRNEVKDYLHEVFHHTLTREAIETADGITRLDSHTYSVEPGRNIHRDGKPFVRVARHESTSQAEFVSPTDADEITRQIVALLNK